MNTKLIILDRDGVINYDSDEYIKSPEEWNPIPRSLEAIARLKNAGYTVVVATNQSGVGRGLYDEATLHRIHDKMQNELKKVKGKIDKIYYCPHTPDDNCSCRKPRAGLFEQIAKDFAIDLKNVPALGDSLRDIQAALTVGCKAVLVRTGNGEKVISENESSLRNVDVYADLFAAVENLIK